MIEAIVNGVLIGGLYAMIALGLSLVFGVMRLVNLAHGELLMGGAYAVFLLVVTLGVGIDPLLAVIVVAPFIFAIAYCVQRSVLTPLLHHGLEPPLVATFGVTIILQAVMITAFTGNSQSLDASYQTTGIEILGMTIRVVYLMALGLGVAMVGATHLALTRTRFGRAMRAASTDPDTAETMGVNTKHLYGVAFGVAAIMAAVGGVMIGVAFSITPTAGTVYLIIGFAVVVVGGLGSIGGVLAGGILIGLTQSIAVELFGGAYRDLIVFCVLILVLAVRPAGLFGRQVEA